MTYCLIADGTTNGHRVEWIYPISGFKTNDRFAIGDMHKKINKKRDTSQVLGNSFVTNTPHNVRLGFSPSRGNRCHDLVHCLSKPSTFIKLRLVHLQKVSSFRYGRRSFRRAEGSFDGSPIHLHHHPSASAFYYIQVPRDAAANTAVPDCHVPGL